MDIKELEDKILLKELVDKVSILGDRKDFLAQVQLFAEDAVSDTFAGGVSILRLEGRKTMAEAFGNFLKSVETVNHFNGQQVVNIDGDKASGTCYCHITLISIEEGKKMKTTILAIYEDEYVRQSNSWFISSRIGTFTWQEKIVIATV
jgi:hypothetical protein